MSDLVHLIANKAVRPRMYHVGRGGRYTMFVGMEEAKAALKGSVDIKDRDDCEIMTWSKQTFAQGHATKVAFDVCKYNRSSKRIVVTSHAVLQLDAETEIENAKCVLEDLI